MGFSYQYLTAAHFSTTDKGATLTALGYHLAQLPVAPRIGKVCASVCVCVGGGGGGGPPPPPPLEGGGGGGGVAAPPPPHPPTPPRPRPKVLLLGAVFRCVGPALTIAASLSTRSPFMSPFDKRAEADKARRDVGGNTMSDHLTLLAAYEGWQAIKMNGSRAEFAFLHENFLSKNTLTMIEQVRGCARGCVRGCVRGCARGCVRGCVRGCEGVRE